MFARLLQIKQVKTSKKILQYLFTSKNNGENEADRVLDGLTTPEVEEIFTTIARNLVSSL